jgi:hypothetical protein
VVIPHERAITQYKSHTGAVLRIRPEYIQLFVARYLHRVYATRLLGRSECTQLEQNLSTKDQQALVFCRSFFCLKQHRFNIGVAVLNGKMAIF